MLNIRPVSDLRNHFSEVEDDVLSKGELVYLIKTVTTPWFCSAWSNTKN